MPQALAVVKVTDAVVAARLREFEDRRRRGTSHYITESDFLELHGAPLNSTLMRRIAGLRVGWTRDGDRMVDMGGENPSLGDPKLEAGCSPIVEVDGAALLDGDVSTVDPSEIVGMHVGSSGCPDQRLQFLQWHIGRDPYFAQVAHIGLRAFAICAIRARVAGASISHEF